MVEGKQTVFFIFIVFLSIVVYFMKRAAGGKVYYIRRIPGLDAIEEAVGRATELGRPVLYVPGRTEITTAGAAQNLAGLEILGHVARLTAKYDTELKVAIAAANVYPVADAVVRQSYLEEGRPEVVKSETVQFVSSQQFAFVAGCLTIMNQDKTASVIMVGEFQAESMMLSEAAAMVGAVTIAGTARAMQVPFFAASCDYTLIGEEIFAGGAYLSKDPEKVANLAAQDYGKVFAFIFIVLGALLATMGNMQLVELLKW